MKEVLLWIIMISLIVAPVEQFQKYTLEDTQTQMEELMMRDLTQQELDALDNITVLMNELFDKTWEVME